MSIHMRTALNNESGILQYNSHHLTDSASNIYEQNNGESGSPISVKVRGQSHFPQADSHDIYSDSNVIEYLSSTMANDRFEHLQLSSSSPIEQLQHLITQRSAQQTFDVSS